eukprot:CAMPEP_0197439522 /NCGR_PEP_ID=MMETSP1175-20131217/6235_1 /TAXON_ID=1003142 /ORGANISM="Triceratium dubium, Strain CCMP147" /LENGTH=562 /DNA_ID=CAMNT_0042969449 /DNA_START=395 /DNA_END=2083 /DNA_ORIENTATION=-
MGGGSGNDAQKQCGLTQLLIFIVAIASGTACSLCSKVMMELHSVGKTGQVELFEKPIFQTFGMFIGMTFGIVMHWAVLLCRIPFPGYDHRSGRGRKSAGSKGSEGSGDGGGEGGRTTSSLLKVTSGVELSQQSPAHHSHKEAPRETDALVGETYVRASDNGAIEIGFADDAVPSSPSGSSSSSSSSSMKTPLWMYFFLAIPSIFDLAATALCMMGLRYLDASVYQMLRGSGIIFVAIMKQNVLGDKLHGYQWAGVFWNVVSVVLVGGCAMLATGARVSGGSDAAEGAGVWQEGVDGASDLADDSAEVRGAGHAFLGVAFMMAGAFVQSLQFVFEEKVMAMDDVAVSPLLLIGMEGVWGTLLCLLVVYPICYLLPGNDHGSFESLSNTWVMIQNSETIQWAFVVYFFTIFAYNLFAVLVTFMLSSVWHAILDNFRPVTVWGVDLFIFYAITAGTHGEPWTKWSYLQLLGMFVLLFGTAVYNAPNAGSVKLTGKFWALFGMDFTDEYLEVEAERRDAELDAKWEEAQRKFRDKEGRKNSSFMGERSPMVSVHTQALRGLGSPKI